MILTYRQFSITAFIAITVACINGSAIADEVILSTSDAPIEGTISNQGWWADVAVNANTSNVSPFLGTTNNSDHRNFFTFFVPSSLSGSQIASATLLQGRGVSSPDNETEETIGLFDVTTNPTTLNHNEGLNLSIWNDLGSGASYGQFIVPGSGPNTTVLELPLNSTGRSELTAHIGSYFSIGGSLLSNNLDDFLFGGNVGGTAALRLVVVPEPSTLLSGSILFAYRYCGRKRLGRNLINC